ncbi:MAG: PAS domain-containing sensor histidine kinase, partial [Acidobacteria bacterium]
VIGTTVQLAGKRKDGSEFPLNLSLSALKIGAETLFLAALQDLSQHSRGEEALRRSEERFRLMVENVQDYAILMLDPQGYVISWNTGAERIKGYRADEIVGQHFSRFYPAEDIVRGKPEYELAVAAEQGHFEDEGWRVRKDGSRLWANVMITALRDESGKLRGFGKVTRDMTERKKIEEEVRIRNAQLEAANKELEAFSYSVSHDLRAPLRAIDGFSLAVLEDYQDKIDAEGRAHLERIRAAAGRMGQLIDDMLQLARIARAEMVRDKVNLSRLAQEIASQLQASEPKRQTTFVIQPGLMVEGDRALLRVVLQNLLDNAWKFTGHQLHARIEFGIQKQDSGQVYFVRDNGAGFEMQYANKLFGVFQRLHRQSEFTGTGVGLATVQRIIHRHGGRIWAEGATGQGATFYFVLQEKYD